MSITSTNGQGIWSSIAPYIAPPLAAAGAITPVFRHMIAKSALQRGEPVPSITFLQGIRAGLTNGAHIVGTIVGAQMILKKMAEKYLFGDLKDDLFYVCIEDLNSGHRLFFAEVKANFGSTLTSAALVGFVSSPLLAIFNGYTMGWSVKRSFKSLTLKQTGAIAFQETAFITGLTAGNQLAPWMKQMAGDSKMVDYAAAFLSGAIGGLAGHPANTALTRWQNGMKAGVRTWFLGAARRTYAVGGLSLGYKILEEGILSTAKKQ